jgi:hypothetical protein
VARQLCCNSAAAAAVFSLDRDESKHGIPLEKYAN